MEASIWNVDTADQVAEGMTQGVFEKRRHWRRKRNRVKRTPIVTRIRWRIARRRARRAMPEFRRLRKRAA
jgi:hypothetical protein